MHIRSIAGGWFAKSFLMAGIWLNISRDERLITEAEMATVGE
jgi:hypothetical protein